VSHRSCAVRNRGSDRCEAPHGTSSVDAVMMQPQAEACAACCERPRRWRTLMTASPVLLEPTIAGPGFGPASAAGATLVIREWTDSGPSYLHIHHCDDEAWHVLEGCLQFRFEHGEVDAPAGTTVFVPAGLAPTYRVIEPSRYLIVWWRNVVGTGCVGRLRTILGASMARGARREPGGGSDALPSSPSPHHPGRPPGDRPIRSSPLVQVVRRPA
jgi:mannose-6-phosphate isomerase-like protein (cupin superfamily)